MLFFFLIKRAENQLPRSKISLIILRVHKPTPYEISYTALEYESFFSTK